MKDELGGRIMREFISLRPKTYAYLMDDNSEVKKAKCAKTCVIKKQFRFNDYKDCLLNNKIVLKSQQRFKSESHDEEVNQIALSRNDDKKLQTFDKITIFPYECWKSMSNRAIKQSKYKMINFDIILVKTKQRIIQSGLTFQIIHTEYLPKVSLDQEKQMRY